MSGDADLPPGQVLTNKFPVVGESAPAAGADPAGWRLTLRGLTGEQQQQVMPTRSYLSQVERTLTFGLGANGEKVSVTIHWPRRQAPVVIEGLSPKTLHVLEEPH